MCCLEIIGLLLALVGYSTLCFMCGYHHAEKKRRNKWWDMEHIGATEDA